MKNPARCVREPERGLWSTTRLWKTRPGLLDLRPHEFNSLWDPLTSLLPYKKPAGVNRLGRMDRNTWRQLALLRTFDHRTKGARSCPVWSAFRTRTVDHSISAKCQNRSFNQLVGGRENRIGHVQAK